MPTRDLMDGELAETGAWYVTGRARVFATGNAEVTAKGAARVWASGRATVHAYDTVRVMLVDSPFLLNQRGSSRAWLVGVQRGANTVFAEEYARLSATGDMLVHAGGDARIVLGGRMHGRARDRARVAVYGGSEVEAEDPGTRAEAFDQARIELFHQAVGRAHDRAWIRAPGRTRAEAFDLAHVDAYDRPTVVLHDRATVSRPPGARVVRGKLVLP